VDLEVSLVVEEDWWRWGMKPEEREVRSSFLGACRG